MEELSKKPTNEIISEMTSMERRIDLLILKYNLYNQEIINRFPFLKEQSEFQDKVLKKGRKHE